MRDLNLTTFITIACMVVDAIDIVKFSNGDWFASFNFYGKNNCWTYVDTKMMCGNNSRKRFEKMVIGSGLTFTYESVTVTDKK